ncbi:NADH-quinone oxidoreductase subunit C [Streptomyces sp. NPDC093970]|uniref:NADH-quinone oxidoreductase subunit C n=1 Tax=Streptomyces sp. NPDC093970 TaxID=3155076 RepID=UPI00343FDBAA
MTAPTGWLPAPADALFGPDATAEESYGVLTVDVPPAAWLAALETARTTLGCTFFDWLSAVDEPGTGFRVSAHVVALAPVRRLLLRTTVPHTTAELPSAVGVYAGARWHERETHEMFGVRFSGHPGLDHLLLPETFEGHPLRKDFVLAARVAKAWPGAKEPGESDHGGPRRRQMLPPGVPDPNDWGPLKGQLPAAPARPARAAAGRPTAEGPARAATERPVRRSRTAAGGSASQTADATAPTPPTTQTPVTQTPVARTQTPATPTPTPTSAPAPASATPTPTSPETSPTGTPSASPATPRRGRSASGGSASQRAASAAEGATAGEGATAPEGTTAAGGTTATEGTTAPEVPTPAAPRGPRRARTSTGGSASQRAQQTPPAPEPAAPARPATPRSPDAPWHHARPAFDEAGDGDGDGGVGVDRGEAGHGDRGGEPRDTSAGSGEPGSAEPGSVSPEVPEDVERAAEATEAAEATDAEEAEGAGASEGAGSEVSPPDFAGYEDSPPDSVEADEAAPERQPPAPREDSPGGPQ